LYGRKFRASDVRHGQEIVIAAIKIQGLLRQNFDKSWIHVCRKMLLTRKRINFSSYAQNEMYKLVFPPTASTVLKDPVVRSSKLPEILPISLLSYEYCNPGTNPMSKDFQQALQQKTVICPLEKMDAVDFQLLGNVMKNPFCQIHSLILTSSAICSHFYENILRQSNDKNGKSITALGQSSPKKFEKVGSTKTIPFNELETVIKPLFDSLKKCSSIRSLTLLAGTWSETSIQFLFHLIQIDNPRIQSLCLEKIENAKKIHSSIALSASHLLKDYFNYSIPGILNLSFHGCALDDEDLHWITEGIMVNSSLERLTLSLNLITDEGMISFMNGLQKNLKSALLYLDCQHNLIRNSLKLRNCLSWYRFPEACQGNQFQLRKQLLEINFQHNPIQLPFDVYEFALESKVPPQMILFYDEEVLQRQKNYLEKLKEKEIEKRKLKEHNHQYHNNRSLVLLGSQNSITGSSYHSTSFHQLQQGSTHSGKLSASSFRGMEDRNFFFETEQFLKRLKTPLPLENRVTSAEDSSQPLPGATILPASLLYQHQVFSSNNHNNGLAVLPPLSRTGKHQHHNRHSEKKEKYSLNDFSSSSSARNISEKPLFSQSSSGIFLSKQMKTSSNKNPYENEIIFRSEKRKK
jgi:hypothetical protein